MYSDPVQWNRIRSRILSGEASIRETSSKSGISRCTIRKMLRFTVPQPYGQRRYEFPRLGLHLATIRRMAQMPKSPRSPAALSIATIFRHIRDSEGYAGSYGAVKDYVKRLEPPEEEYWEQTYDLIASFDRNRGAEFLSMLSRAEPPIISKRRAHQFFADARQQVRESLKPSKRSQRRSEAFEWMRAVLHKDISKNVVSQELKALPDLETYIDRIYEGRLSERNRSLAILANERGFCRKDVREFLGISKGTLQRYIQEHRSGGAAQLFGRKPRSTTKVDDEELKHAIFDILHRPPSAYGINRTSWKMDDLSCVLNDAGTPACREVIRKIVKAAGYRWRKARIALTSHDPEYSDKLGKVQDILAALGPDEAFFSIDEFGPFAVKMKPGLMLVPPSTQRIVPQWQKSRGCLILTAALELSSNQVTHFYSKKKNTDEMLKMMDLLTASYAERRTIYLSWDAASWHISKKLQQRIELHNQTAASIKLPRVEIAPLPAGAQFLNVIESVFSGMARAVIHNSDYQSVDDAMSAIDQYFEDRNLQFQRRPKRAGKKIWGKEREPPSFSPSNNCKDPRYR